jgi:hypothetical protein
MTLALNIPHFPVIETTQLDFFLKDSMKRRTEVSTAAISRYDAFRTRSEVGDGRNGEPISD